ncbi:hypothetical protein TNCT_711391 [Trichonephila clavata]|uniref:Uncharacterized protein n=1 Tax=Trichonephila clavata TaxID=2740835 RepID=A0A8X6IYI1_TRICU|nr:hypothetical protein TNCT_711391 [Trichonephila clavata]
MKLSNEHLVWCLNKRKQIALHKQEKQLSQSTEEYKNKTDLFLHVRLNDRPSSDFVSDTYNEELGVNFVSLGSFPPLQIFLVFIKKG